MPDTEEAVPTIWGLLGSILVHGQSFFVYPAGFLPYPRHVNDPSRYGIPFTLEELQTPDRVTIHCHLMLYSQYREKGKYGYRLHRSPYPENGRGSIMMFHGNAMNHGDHVDLAEEFLKQGFNVLTTSYRGYGNSTGTPSESGLKIDAQTALDYLLQHETLSSVPVIVYGQSLGGAVAIYLASQNPGKVSAVIVENTFTSIPLLVKDFPAPLRTFPFLCTQKWPSIERIQKIPASVPILMLGGDRDLVVRPKHLQALWAVAINRGDSAPVAVSNKRKSRGSSSNLKADAKESDPDSVSEVPGCFTILSRSGSTTSVNKVSPSDIMKSLEVQYGDVKMSNGKDMYRLFEHRTHVNTCRSHEYWPTVRTFLDGLDPPTQRGEASRSTSIDAPSSLRERPLSSLL